MESQLEDLAGRLDDISEQLAELGIEVLREALEISAAQAQENADEAGSGKSATKPPQVQLEKQLARARNAVLKAAELLRTATAQAAS